MSELGFTGKIPIPNLKQVGDLSGEITKQQQIQLQSGALRAKQQKSKAEALKKLHENQAKVKGQLGGLYDNVHAFALPFVEEAAEKLEQQALMYMQVENGAEIFKPMVENFKSSVTPYVTNADMMKSRGQLTAMIDHSGEEYKAANKEVGKLFNVVANEDMVFAADDHQFKNLMQDTRLEYDNGRFKIVGRYVDRKSGKTDDEITELSLAPMFNDPTEYQYGTQRANVLSLQQIGEGIKGEDTSAAQNSGWDAKRVTEKYANLYENYVDFDAMAETDNDEYAFRLASYFATRQDVIARSPLAQTFKDDEQLLEYYELNPQKRKSGDAALYDLVKDAIKESWTTATLPHTKWEIKDSKSRGQVKLDILKNSETATLPINELPIDPQKNKPVEGIVMNTDDPKNPTVRSVLYPIQEIPSAQAENIKVTYVNPKYYDDMRLYLTTPNSAGNPYATINDYGKIELGLPENPTQQDRLQAGAIADMMQEVDFQTESPVDGIRVYENNPTKYVLSLVDGPQLLIDRDNINTAEDQMINASLKIGLDKANLTLDDLWNDAVKKFGATPATRTDAFGQPIE